MPSHMHNHMPEAVARLHRELAPVRGLWNGFEADMAAIGVSSLEELRDKSPDDLLRRYCLHTGIPHDPVLHAHFEAVVRFAKTGEVQPAWAIMRQDAVRDQNRLFAATIG